MNCPVCSEKMKTIERSGVEIEICPGCKGIWLDAGELEKLLALDEVGDAKQAAEAAPEPAETTPQTGVYAPMPDEMPAEYKHQDRSRFRDAAKHAGAGVGGYKPVMPSGGKAPRGQGGKGQSGAMRSVLESIRKGGAG